MLDWQNPAGEPWSERVVVRRDSRGIYYVQAETEADLYFAQGYVTASDRLWQMDLLRRTGRGELAEIFGRGMLPADRRRRLFGFTRIAEAAWPRLSAGVQAMLEAYAQGVNAFMRRCAEEGYPREFGALDYTPRAWSLTDSLVVGKVFAERLSHSWLDDVARVTLCDLPPARLRDLLPIVSPLDEVLLGSAEAPAEDARGKWEDWPRYRVMQPSDALRAVQEIQRDLGYGNDTADERAASNCWIAGGGRSASGKPLLANDPHLAPSLPCVWHLIHLSAPALRVSGSTMPGIPGILIGHNQRVAWGITNALVDVQDVYVEKFDPGDPQRYWTPDGWRAADVREETIVMRRGPDAQEQDSVVFKVYVTRHGPIMHRQENTGLAVQWTALDPAATELEALYNLNRAQNCEEVVSALADYGGPVQSFIFGDCDGHIGFHYAGKVPIRSSGEGMLPYDGSADEGEWRGFVPFEQLPHLIDPPEGLIAIANNRLVGPNYPCFLSNDWEPPYRAHRIKTLLNAQTRHTVETFQAIQGDVFSLPGIVFAREIARCVRAEAPEGMMDREWLAAVERLEGWDGQVRASCRISPLVAEMRGEFRRRLLVSALGPERAAVFRWRSFPVLMDKILCTRPAEWLPNEFPRYSELAYACYCYAVKALCAKLGPERSRWNWGAYEAKNLAPHPLARLPGEETHFQTPSQRPFQARQWSAQGSASAAGPTVNAGVRVSMRFVADLADWDRTLQGIPFGQSGDPLAVHGCDQMQSWCDCDTQPFAFSDSGVMAQTVEVPLRR